MRDGFVAAPGIAVVELEIEEATVATQSGKPAMARRNVMERVIETLATGLGNGIGWMAESGVLFALFLLLWVAFGAGLVFSQGSIDQVWQAIGGLPLLVQALAWLLLLPVMAGLWVWETSWPFLVRLTLVLGVAGWSLLVLLPKGLQSRS